MTQTSRWFLVMVVLLVTVSSSVLVLAQATDPLETLCAASQSLTAYSATIRMTQCQGKNQSVIEFTFDFVPPNRMRIVYTAPDTVEGQTMILNADKFYTYIPSLHRSVWQDVKDGSGNQGKEMGFLYDFVTCSAAAALNGGVAQVEEEGQTYVLESTDETIDVSVLTLTTDDERQVILLNTSDDAPVAISIYQDDELTMEIQVLGYQMNGDFDASWFDIPEK